MAVDHTVAKAGGLGPGDVWEPILDFDRELGGLLAEDGEVPQQRIATLAVLVERFQRDSRHELSRLLGSFA